MPGDITRLKRSRVEWKERAKAVEAEAERLRGLVGENISDLNSRYLSVALRLTDEAHQDGRMRQFSREKATEAIIADLEAEVAQTRADEPPRSTLMPQSRRTP